jgi:hypothetical protein
MSKELTKLKKRADTIYSKYVRYRDGEVRNGEWQTQCITCQEWKPLKQMQNGHFVSRGKNILRYDDLNCNGQCYTCNVIKHGDLYEYAKQLDLKYGDGTAERLHSMRTQTKKLTISELEQIIADAQEYIKELEEL